MDKNTIITNFLHSLKICWRSSLVYFGTKEDGRFYKVDRFYKIKRSRAKERSGKSPSRVENTGFSGLKVKYYFIIFDIGREIRLKGFYKSSFFFRLNSTFNGLYDDRLKRFYKANYLYKLTDLLDLKFLEL